MTPIKDLFTRFFKKKNNGDVWLDYYSREDNKIKFTIKILLH